MVGDSLRDIEAGLRVGMATAMILGDDDEPTAEDDRAAALAQVSVRSLSELVRSLLRLFERLSQVRPQARKGDAAGCGCGLKIRNL